MNEFFKLIENSTTSLINVCKMSLERGQNLVGKEAKMKDKRTT